MRPLKLSWNISVVELKKRFGVDRITGSFEDGIIECSFTLEVVRNLPTQHDGHVLIDLTEPYYLVLGSGILNDNNRSQSKPKMLIFNYSKQKISRSK